MAAAPFAADRAHLLRRAARLAAMTLDRQSVAIATAHLAGAHDVVTSSHVTTSPTIPPRASPAAGAGRTIPPDPSSDTELS
jgi:hypothetical protein